ncbi:hypothetical protein [Inhella sp.]|uniref:hypothetical protein n=1 Tax=Inhella sp. TaxID=1921806 RepID=UPI0035B3D797
MVLVYLLGGCLGPLLCNMKDLALAPGPGALILGQHALQLGGLPWNQRDPFDRLLVAQAMAEPMRLLTADEQLLAYGGQVELI